MENQSAKVANDWTVPRYSTKSESILQHSLVKPLFFYHKIAGTRDVLPEIELVIKTKWCGRRDVWDARIYSPGGMNSGVNQDRESISLDNPYQFAAQILLYACTPCALAHLPTEERQPFLLIPTMISEIIFVLFPIFAATPVFHESIEQFVSRENAGQTPAAWRQSWPIYWSIRDFDSS